MQIHSLVLHGARGLSTEDSFFSIGKDFIFIFILFSKIFCVSSHSRSLFFLLFCTLRISHRQELRKSMHIPETPYEKEHMQLMYKYR